MRAEIHYAAPDGTVHRRVLEAPLIRTQTFEGGRCHLFLHDEHKVKYRSLWFSSYVYIEVDQEEGQ